MVRLFQGLIKIYNYIVSPFLGRNCRYTPTCSAYCHEALEKHGVLKGLYLGIRRVLSCHPYSKRNYIDDVPKQFAWKRLLGYKRLCNQKNKTIENNKRDIL